MPLVSNRDSTTCGDRLVLVCNGIFSLVVAIGGEFTEFKSTGTGIDTRIHPPLNGKGLLGGGKRTGNVQLLIVTGKDKTIFGISGTNA